MCTRRGFSRARVHSAWPWQHCYEAGEGGKSRLHGEGEGGEGARVIFVFPQNQRVVLKHVTVVVGGGGGAVSSKITTCKQHT